MSKIKVFCVPDLPFLLLRNLTGEDICSMMLRLLLNLTPDQSDNRKHYDAGEDAVLRHMVLSSGRAGQSGRCCPSDVVLSTRRV